MRQQSRPDGIVCGSGGATFGLVAGIEAAGLVLGSDVDIIAKQSTNILPWFRSRIRAASEDVGLAGRELAAAVLGKIAGKDPADLQSLSAPNWRGAPFPDDSLSPIRPA